MNELERFRAKVKEDGTSAFDDEHLANNQGKLDAAESLPDKDKEDEKPEAADPADKADEGEPIAFHKHPRWIKQMKEKEELSAKVSELEDFKLKVQEQLKEKPEVTQGDLPKYWTLQWGNSEASRIAYKEFQEGLVSQLKSDIKKESVEEFTKIELKEREAVKEYENELTSNLEDLKDSGAEFDQEKLLSIIDEYTPKDDDGNYTSDFFPMEQAYKIYQLQYPKKAPVIDTQRQRITRVISPQNTTPTATAPKQSASPRTTRIKWDSWREQL